MANDLWQSLAGLTGEDFITNGQLHQSRDGFSKWKRWFDDNKSVLDAKFKAEAKAAVQPAATPLE
ncbi:MAG: hypothetical protein ABIF71_13415 [Planctomycetota bacterium]